ncbi:MAG TPA: glutathione S-transferase family protein [Gammaproteobacteria bacterium]|nr:glutathione S-transferase family protein [Gammaproteobacteria bacterium]
MKLYDLARSGNCYKIRLFLSILGLDYELIPVDANAGELRTPEFLAVNPNGLVPVLIDGDTTVYDSAAILAYLALTRGAEDWFSTEPLRLARILRWLTFEQAEGRYGLARARAMALSLRTPLAESGTLEESRGIAETALKTLEQRLSEHDWLAGDGLPTIADIACYPYTALIPDAGISLDAYAAIGRWMEAIRGLPGYIPLPEIANR